MKLQHLHCTSMETSLVAGIPTPLSAVHLYSLTSCLLKLINGMVTLMLSAILVHVILGVGLPSAMHFRVTSPLSLTVSPVVLVMVGGTEGKQRRGEEWCAVGKKETP